MRVGLHANEWKVLETTCAKLTSTPDIAWAGIAETKLEPTWIAFSGADEDVPLPPEQDQGFRELEPVPPGITIALLRAPTTAPDVRLRPGRSAANQSCRRPAGIRGRGCGPRSSAALVGYGGAAPSRASRSADRPHSLAPAAPLRCAPPI